MQRRGDDTMGVDIFDYINLAMGWPSGPACPGKRYLPREDTKCVHTYQKAGHAEHRGARNPLVDGICSKSITIRLFPS